MKISREIKTAILVLSGIALFIYLFSYLKGEDLFTTTNTYYTEFDYNALSMSSPVTIRGNKVGKIEDISYEFKTGTGDIINSPIVLVQEKVLRLSKLCVVEKQKNPAHKKYIVLSGKSLIQNGKIKLVEECE